MAEQGDQSVLDKALFSVSNRVNHLREAARQINEQVTGATSRLEMLSTRMEDDGKWQEQLREAVSLSEEIVDRIIAKSELKSQVDAAKKDIGRWEGEQRLEIQEELNGEGKRRYPNDKFRADALLKIQQEDQEYARLQDSLQAAELRVLQYEVETKKLEEQKKAKWAYVSMIEARLRAMAR